MSASCSWPWIWRDGREAPCSRNKERGGRVLLRACRAGVVYCEELLPKASALLFSRSPQTARAAFDLLRQTVEGGGERGRLALIGRAEECADTAALFCVTRAPVLKTSSSSTASANLSFRADDASPPLAEAPLEAVALSLFGAASSGAVASFGSLLRHCCGERRVSWR